MKLETRTDAGVSSGGETAWQAVEYTLWSSQSASAVLKVRDVVWWQVHSEVKGIVGVSYET